MCKNGPMTKAGAKESERKDRRRQTTEKGKQLEEKGILELQEESWDEGGSLPRGKNIN